MIQTKFDWAQFQEDLRVWTAHNFGSRRTEENATRHPRLGVVEEVGELAHAVLKREQGIRGTPEEHLWAERDALGDIVIYFADWCNESAVSLSRLRDVIATTGGWTDVSFLAKQAGLFAYNPHVHSITFFEATFQYAGNRGWDLEEIVQQTWERIRQRDWIKYPHDGLTR